VIAGLTDEQRAMRRTGIGGSEIAAVVGLDPYRTPLDVYLGKVEGYEEPDNAAMERGRFLEAGVAAWYAHRTGRVLMPCSTIRHPSTPVLLCTPDRIGMLDGHRPRDLSIKVPGPYVREQWGEAGTDEVPVAYAAQVQLELFILVALEMSEPIADLAAPVDGDLRIYTLTADPELQAMLVEGAERFWRDHVEPRKPPPLDHTPSSARWLTRRFQRDTQPLRKATLEDEVLAAELQEALAVAAEATDRATLLEHHMRERIGETSGIEGAGWRVTWKANKNGVRSFRIPKDWRKP
jgi:putative phage-type endonuclease